MALGGERYVTNVCMYAALFRLYSGIITQTARRRESVPLDGRAGAVGRGMCMRGMGGGGRGGGRAVLWVRAEYLSHRGCAINVKQIAGKIIRIGSLVLPF